jgi:hypothetical protein
MSENENTIESTKKISPIPVPVPVKDRPDSRIINRSNPIIYNEILQEIRNMNVLSNYQLYHLRTSRVSRSDLIEIIELYNFVVRNINEIL